MALKFLGWRGPRAAVVMLLLAAFVVLQIWGEVVSRRISQPGYYRGVVLAKPVSQGRNSSTFFLDVQWGELGRQTILSSPSESGRLQIGDTVTAQYSYSYVLGACGTAYVPSDPSVPEWLLLVSGITRAVALLVLLAAFVGWLFTGWNKRD